jgi:hypothetical protein
MPLADATAPKSRALLHQNPPQLVGRHGPQLIASARPVNSFVLDRYAQHVGRRGEDEHSAVRMLDFFKLDSELKASC